ncbi:MAG TPA: tRNA lysidine(34) synthetase TilS [Casimicrobiaceae bacterium]|nr:tRNA lysidine(34) synthetase TilS [Casimicrobiaceae bacterium]
MAGTRSSPRPDGVVDAVGRALAQHVDAGQRIGVALSGGRDSVALLAAVVECARVPATDVTAFHVHHGLSSHADAWAAFCQRIAASLDVRCVLRRVIVPANNAAGTEAAARAARYDALRSAALAHRASIVLLAHHRDDQAETLLLQLLRGAGPHGLASMPASREANGVVWMRPLLDVTRSDIDAYVASRNLAYVDDDSNASARHRRNALRQHLLPAVARFAPSYSTTLARVAAHQAESASLLDELARLDAMSLVSGDTLDRAGLVSLGVPRARNLLRYFLRSQGLRPPSAARLSAMLAQLASARRDANVAIAHDGSVVGVFRGRVILHSAPTKAYERQWHYESVVALPHGQLTFVATTGAGLSMTKLSENVVTVRSRRGGERMQIGPNRPRRALKSLFQEAGLPPWQRQSLPLVFCGDALVAAPGIGIDAAFAAPQGVSGVLLEWQPQR